MILDDNKTQKKYQLIYYKVDFYSVVMVSISNVTFVIFVTFLTIGCIAKNKNNDYQEQAADSFSNLSANDEVRLSIP